MATHKNLSELFTAIANAIRAVDDTIVGKLKADDFPTIISNIQTGIDTTLPVNEAAAAGDIVSGKKAFVNETLVTGTLAARTSLTFSSVTNATSAVTVKGKHTARFIGNANTDISISVPYTNLASAIGLTAAKIAKGQTIAGISGTFSTPSSGTAITAAAVRTGYTGFVNGAEIKGSMPNVTHAKPTATVDKTTGIVTASHNQATAGYISTGTTTNTLQLTPQEGTTFTPDSTTKKIISQGTYCTGDIYIGPGGAPVVTGSVSEVEGTTSSTYTISTTFKPKGFVMFAERATESATVSAVYCLYDLTGSGTVTGYCTYSTEVHHGIEILSALFHSAVNDYDSGIISDIINTYYGGHASNVEFNPYNVTWTDNDGTTKVSILETMFMSDDIGGYQATMAGKSIFNNLTGDSALLFDDVYSRASAYITDALLSLDTYDTTFETATATYSSTGVTITVPMTTTDNTDEPLTGITCYNMDYVIWG